MRCALVAQAFDFSGTTKQWGAPSFAQFAKGGNRGRIHNGILCRRGENCVGRIATRPCKERKDGAPSA